MYTSSSTTIWTIIQQVGLALLVPIAAAVGLWISQKIKIQSQQIAENNQKLKDMIIQRSIFAAEQKYDEGQNEEKLNYALKIAEIMLKERKIKYNKLLLPSTIEAEIWTSLNSPSAKIGAAVVVAPINVPFVEEPRTIGESNIL